MAKSFAQHFLECENCEENPAQFLCKTCPGHLCETCKTDHETKKITKNHEIIHLHKNKEGTMGLLYCGKHTVNKLEWYCSPCKEPVCSKCLIEFHNGHKLDDLAAIYQKIISNLKDEKEEIEGVILPKYREMLSKEKIKKSEISKRTDEVKKQIEDHTKLIMNQVKKVKENAIRNLQEEEKKALKSIEETENEIERRIETLGKIDENITSNMRANPGITFFTNIDYDTLRHMQGFPSMVNYKLSDFQPGELFKAEHFGKSPKLLKSEESNLKTEHLLRRNKAAIAMRQKLKDLELQSALTNNFSEWTAIRKEIDLLNIELNELERNEN
ncbi:E3 ubiquitin-protein ligase TRIM71-like [Saccostrea cucullata]|uniref:E3 ubiquitin-protein ligase TRIM71-like n=1 Tax=Saccostrea cuccullata TaxID=36930 RepID=UPI002ED5E2C0